MLDDAAFSKRCSKLSIDPAARAGYHPSSKAGAIDDREFPKHIAVDIMSRV